jgi:hypothetical protein
MNRFGIRPDALEGVGGTEAVNSDPTGAGTGALPDSPVVDVSPWTVS